MKLAIVGCRNYNDYETFRFHVNNALSGDPNNKIIPEAIISGGAKGIDNLAEIYAREIGLEPIIKEAKWKKYGNPAGPKRNMKIARDCTHMIAFPSKTSIGTWSSIKFARDMGKEVIVINI